jgi:hypothetical protein
MLIKEIKIIKIKIRKKNNLVKVIELYASQSKKLNLKFWTIKVPFIVKPDERLIIIRVILRIEIISKKEFFL